MQREQVKPVLLQIIQKKQKTTSRQEEVDLTTGDMKKSDETEEACHTKKATKKQKNANTGDMKKSDETEEACQTKEGTMKQNNLTTGDMKKSGETEVCPSKRAQRNRRRPRR